jgi:hypothetical protein
MKAIRNLFFRTVVVKCGLSVCNIDSCNNKMGFRKVLIHGFGVSSSGIGLLIKNFVKFGLFQKLKWVYAHTRENNKVTSEEHCLCVSVRDVG